MRPGDPGVNRKVVVGTVLKPVGLKGELKIRPLTDNPDRYAPGGKLWFTSPPGGPGGKPGLESGPFTVKSQRPQKDCIVVLLDGIDSVDEAVEFRGQEVFVPESEVPPLPEGEYYHYQIEGLEVYTHKGRLLGTVTGIISAGEKDVYEVRGGGREYLIPVNEDTVAEINVEAGRITLFDLKGYIPEDEM